MAHAGSGSARFDFSANGGSLKFRDVVRERFRGHAHGQDFTTWLDEIEPKPVAFALTLFFFGFDLASEVTMATLIKKAIAKLFISRGLYQMYWCSLRYIEGL